MSTLQILLTKMLNNIGDNITDERVHGLVSKIRAHPEFSNYVDDSNPNHIIMRTPNSSRPPLLELIKVGENKWRGRTEASRTTDEKTITQADLIEMINLSTENNLDEVEAAITLIKRQVDSKTLPGTRYKEIKDELFVLTRGEDYDIGLVLARISPTYWRAYWK